MNTTAPLSRGLPLQAKLWLEWLALFIAPPLLVLGDWLPVNRWLLLAAPIAYALLVYWRQRLYRQHDHPAVDGRELRRVILAFVLFGAVLLAAVAWWLPERLFDFPRQRPALWLLVIALYPFLSALPQEFLYRRFYFLRYRPLFPQPSMMIASSAGAFCFLHIFYQNAIALGLSLIGGILFALTYQRRGSLRACWLEHALYGQWLFTIGLGQYFYRGVT